MCRHLCYLGDPIPLSELLLKPEHSLLVQSYAPKDMRGGGSVNGDGFGFGWFVDPTGSDPAALRYRRAVPMWQDAGLADLAAGIAAPAVLAAVRNATTGMPVTETAAAPFTDGRWLFSLNGRIDGWPNTMHDLAASLPDGDLLTMDAPTDAAFIWAVLRRRLSAEYADPAAALAELVTELLAAAPGSRLNLLLTDGRQAYASTVTHSLWFRSSGSATVLASEPLDDGPGWQPIADHQLIVADRFQVAARSLPIWSARSGPISSSDSEIRRESEINVDQR